MLVGFVVLLFVLFFGLRYITNCHYERAANIHIPLKIDQIEEKIAVFVKASEPLRDFDLQRVHQTPQGSSVYPRREE